METIVMRHSAFLRALPVLLLALGCATLSRTPSSCPTAFEDVLDSPALLHQEYEKAFREKRWDRAYRYLTLIHILHPDSAEDRELFTAAASLFKGRYLGDRAKHPGSIWALSEPALMIQWILHILAQSDEFPEEAFIYLFRSMPKDFFDQFMLVAKQQRVPKKWDILATEDSGRIASVTGTRIDTAGAAR
jgi:hypothetical protein